MKRITPPLDSLPDLDELSGFLKDYRYSNDDLRQRLIRLTASERLLPEDKRLSPDTYGADRLFIDCFVNDEMTSDFLLIARDLFSHEFANMSNYDDALDLDINTFEDRPEHLFIRFTMTLMVNAVHGGSEYTKALFLYLYKTYYKQEFKTLKRFRSISRDELLSLADSEDDNSFYFGNLSRILCIAKLSGIEISPECNIMYAILNEYSDWRSDDERFSLDEVTGDPYRNCLKEIEENYASKKLYSLNGKISRYVGNVLKWLGYSPDFADMCDDNVRGITGDLAITLSILKKSFPNREFSAEELTVYDAVRHCASALTCNMDWMTETLKTLAYGESGTYYFDMYPPLFHPEDVKIPGSKQKKKETVLHPKKPAPETNASQNQYNEDTLLAEIDTLRRKVHKLVSDNNSLRTEIADRKRKEEEAKVVRDQLEAASSELASLRDYVYNLTEDDSPSQTVSTDSMKEAISNLRIVIIGGHSNWISKMKREFPGWTFIKPEASGSTDASIVDKADYVYFFTDTISHSRYYQFLNVIRERKIDFGYIHGVNIEKNIRDIYRDCGKE